MSLKSLRCLITLLIGSDSNRLPHPYLLDEPTSIFSGIRNNLYFIFKEIHVSKQNSPRWGYTVFLGTINRTLAYKVKLYNCTLKRGYLQLTLFKATTHSGDTEIAIDRWLLIAE